MQPESDSHPMSKPVLAIGLEADDDRRAIIKDALGDTGDAVYLMDMEEAERRVMMTTGRRRLHRPHTAIARRWHWPFWRDLQIAAVLFSWR